MSLQGNIFYIFMCLQCSNDSVLGAVFHPMDASLIVTCGKSHINFWTMEGNTLTKRQGLFEVRHDSSNVTLPSILTSTLLAHYIVKKHT